MIALLLQRLNKQRGSEIMTQVLRQPTCYGKLPEQKWTQSDLFWRGVGTIVMPGTVWGLEKACQ